MIRGPSFGLIATLAVLAGGACKDRRPGSTSSKSTGEPGSLVHHKEPSRPAKALATQVIDTLSTGVADVDAASKIALPMCAKPLGEVTSADVRSYPRFVAALRSPVPAADGEDEDDPFAALEEDYRRSGILAFRATGAAVYLWLPGGFSVMVVGDGSDPCKVTEGDDFPVTEKGNSAIKITIGGHGLGERVASVSGEGIRYSAEVAGRKSRILRTYLGQGFFRVTKVAKGEGAELTVHACENQAGSPGPEPLGKDIPLRYFAIGPISATWCPNAEP